jgi:protein TonB
MSSTTTYKLIRMGVLAALITGGAVACKYKAGSDYKDNSDTTSANMPAAAPATPTNKAKFTRGRASVTAPKIYTTAEVAPQFPGGQRALDNYINKSVNYPQQAIDDDVSGTVHVSFVVDEKGRVTKAKVVNVANVGDGLDLEALRVVKNMPQWMPGKVNGKRVKTRMELPISFQVES